ncbi:MAG: OmpA family protein [Candidatus Eisenbacteria bacterium]|nr:OmpA family protein [Candidatus Latescibacterota bacterium]MBD3302107.1 OmpA family protein [Candidatus Eisenbacteria bacterium]
MDRSNRREVGWIGIGAVGLLVLGAGCATKGFVRSEVEALRASMTERTEQLAAQMEEVRNSAEDASRRADLALGTAEESRSLALGGIGYREVSRHSISFAFDSSALDGGQTANLDEAAALIRERPDVIVDVYGFTDPRGPEEYNRKLGKRRAESVLRYLVERTPGPYERFAVVSFGEGRPATSELGESAARQRKVVVSLYEKVPRAEGDRAEWN